MSSDSSSSSPLSFAGRVAIVTGAGGALGRAYALLLASRGCSVVVNDLGVPLQGSGSSSSPAQKVVEEITKAGGKAIVNTDNVLDGEKIVKAAIDAFGRVDIVINNAGILRDVTFLKMSEQQWNIIMQVHLEGAMKVTKAAWPYMLKQKYGRVIMTSSASGLYGNIGQANYSAAKLALVGFSSTLAKEGAKSNVYCNVIAPIAGSRMTESILPKELVEALDPKYVAPVVAWLCHEKCTANGAIYETGAGYCAAVHWQRSEGVHFPIADNAFTPEVISAKWKDVNSFDKKNSYPQGLNDTLAVVTEKVSSTGLSTNLGKGKPQLKANKTAGSDGTFASDAIFDQLAAAVKTDPSIAAKINAIFVYNITKGKDGADGKKTWIVNMKKDCIPATVTSSATGEEKLPAGKKADVTIDVSDEDYVALAAGKQSAQMLYMKGRLKMKGNLATAMKFDSLIKAAQAKAKL